MKASARDRPIPVRARGPRARALAWLAPLALAGGACTVHPAGHERPVDPPGAFERGGAAPVPDRWWRSFEDPTLNALQSRALDGNFDLAAARDRLLAARATVTRESAADYPALDLSLSASHQHREPTPLAEGDELGGGLVAEYELDLWNRIDSQIEEAELQQEASRETLEAAAITLSANVASTWYALVQQRGQRAILNEQIRTNRQVLDVVRTRFAYGGVRASDVLRQERLLESTLEQREQVRSRIETLEHQLLVLTGRSPTTEIGASREALPGLPPKPETGLPSELVHRRPDVRAAFYEMRAADRGVAVAIAERYPSITLSASALVSAGNAASLFDDWVQTIASDLLQPVFDAGRREAEVRRTKSVKQERLDVYGQTVLTAFREVTDALSSERYQKERIRRIRRQVDLSERTSDRLQREYLNGDISYIDVLDSLTREQQLQRDLLQARFELIDTRIALYRALAGGWDGIVPPGRNGSS